MKTSSLTSLLLLALSAFAGLSAQASSDTSSPSIFSTEDFLHEVTALKPSWIETIQRHDPRRYRVVRLQLPHQLPTRADRVEIKLFEDLTVTSQTQRVRQHSATSVSWFGSVAGDRNSYIGVTYRDGAVTGSAYLLGNHYRVIRLASRTYALLEIDPQPEGDCGTPDSDEGDIDNE